MNAIKKRLQTLKIEKDLQMDRADACDQQAREANKREEILMDEVVKLEKKFIQMQQDLKTSRENLKKSNVRLEEREHSLLIAQSELAISNRKLQQCIVNLEKNEERRLAAQNSLALSLETADDAFLRRKFLENRRKVDGDRMDQLTIQLKNFRDIVEDADTKSEEISRKLIDVEDELGAAEDRVKYNATKIAEREDELFIVGNCLKSLVVSEEKASQRVKEFKKQLKELKTKLHESEKRADVAEFQITVLQKELDRREDKLSKEKEKCKYICNDLDSTFADLTGY